MYILCINKLEYVYLCMYFLFQSIICIWRYILYIIYIIIVLYYGWIYNKNNIYYIHQYMYRMYIYVCTFWFIVLAHKVELICFTSKYVFKENHYLYRTSLPVNKFLALNRYLCRVTLPLNMFLAKTALPLPYTVYILFI